MLLAAFIPRRAGIARWPFPLAAAGTSTLYEALLGSCVLRACKSKTRLQANAEK
jgi:hypothetical protein